MIVIPHLVVSRGLVMMTAGPASPDPLSGFIFLVLRSAWSLDRDGDLLSGVITLTCDLRVTFETAEILKVTWLLLCHLSQLIQL